ncbi:MAG: hypothetical protein LBV27_00245, partial [Oscillospiraceae bacterium]|nr:hypothetical protein [Oscillospiraceae bacterium]
IPLIYSRRYKAARLINKKILANKSTKVKSILCDRQPNTAQINGDGSPVKPLVRALYSTSAHPFRYFNYSTEIQI